MFCYVIFCAFILEYTFYMCEHIYFDIILNILIPNTLCYLYFNHFYVRVQVSSSNT